MHQYSYLSNPSNGSNQCFHVLQQDFAPLGLSICFMAEYWLPDIERLRPLSCPYELRTLYPEDFAEYFETVCADIFKTHDCAELVSFIVSVHNKRKKLADSKKKLSAIDERFMKKAEDLLFGELASALGIQKSEVYERVSEKLG